MPASIGSPATLPEYLEGRTPKEKHPFLFQEKIHPRQNRNARSVFSFGVAGVLASAWGFLRAYASVSLHHARGACEVITPNSFGKMGGTAWACLRHAHSLVGSQPLSSILVEHKGLEPLTSCMPCKRSSQLS